MGVSVCDLISGGRARLTPWRDRRSEDIVWLKTNKVSPASDLELSPVGASPSPLVASRSLTHGSYLTGLAKTALHPND